MARKTRKTGCVHYLVYRQYTFFKGKSKWMFVHEMSGSLATRMKSYYALRNETQTFVKYQIRKVVH